VTEPDGETKRRVREMVARDLQPVRPLLRPGRRVLLVAPVAVAAVGYAVFGYGHRDFDRLGLLAGWGVSALQWIAGLLLLGAALRHAVPGRDLSRRSITATVAGAIGLVVLVTVVTYAIEPSEVPPGVAFTFWWECVKWPMALAAPILLVASLLAMRALPTQPGVVGALCGLAAGVLADSGWRLACDVSAPGHVLGAHGVAILLLAAVGAVVGLFVDSVRR
jgi:hypothetical protein